MASDEFAIKVKGVSKSYDGLVALAGIDLEVKRGEVFGILGRNGAGKTTLIEIIEGLRNPDKGSISVLGMDPTRNLDSIKERIGVQLQATAFIGNLKVIEILKQFRNYYSQKADLEELLLKVALSEVRNKYAERISGGQRQRLALAQALVNNPDILFLDEPTSGLDTSIRRQLWYTIGEMKKEGKTVLLTTHYIDEAERLCDRVCIMEAGQVIALDSPSKLIAKVRGNSARIRLTTARPLAVEDLRAVCVVDAKVNGDAQYVMETKDTGPAVVDLVNCIERQKNELLDLHIVRASLEDVFVELTGREIQ